MRPILLITAFTLTTTAFSQAIVDVSSQDNPVAPSIFFSMAQGYPVLNTKYVRLVDGSPYFNEEWMKGKIAMEKGQVYDSMRLRLDLLANELQYIGPNGNPFVATTLVRGVTIKDSITGSQHHFVHSHFLNLPAAMEQGWYQVLAAGPATLYMKTLKLISENKPYGSATVQQTISTSYLFFIEKNQVFTRVKKISDLPAILSDKKDELTSFTRHNSGKSEQDFHKAVTYYNQLLEK